MQRLVFEYLDLPTFTVDLDLCFTEDRSTGCTGKYMLLIFFAIIIREYFALPGELVLV